MNMVLAGLTLQNEMQCTCAAIMYIRQHSPEVDSRRLYFDNLFRKKAP